MTPCAYPPRPVLSREAGKLKGEDNISVQKSVGFLGPVPNAAPLMCRTKLSTVRFWSHFGATADSDGVLASDLIREGHGNQFSLRYMHSEFTNSVRIENLRLISRC